MSEIAASEHNHKLPHLTKFLDRYFFDICEVKNPILYEKTKLLGSAVVEPENIKQQYHLLEQPAFVLRFDHTYPLFLGRPYEVPDVNLKNVGPVFRNDFKSGIRWREFNQYDVDYLYEDHQIRPLLVAQKVVAQLNLDYVLVVNDLALLKDACGISNITEKNVKSILESKNLDLVAYENAFYQKYPVLKDFKLKIDVNLVRGWSYYTDLVFEFTSVLKKVSFVAGGTYVNKKNSKKYLGVSFGLDRILKLQKLTNSERSELVPVLLIYNKCEDVPYALLNALEEKRIPYVLKKSKKDLKTDYPKYQKTSALVGQKIQKILIVGSEDLKTNTYQFKSDRDALKKKYDLATLVHLIEKLIPKI